MSTCSKTCQCMGLSKNGYIYPQTAILQGKRGVKDLFVCLFTIFRHPNILIITYSIIPLYDHHFRDDFPFILYFLDR